MVILGDFSGLLSSSVFHRTLKYGRTAQKKKKIVFLKTSSWRYFKVSEIFVAFPLVPIFPAITAGRFPPPYVGNTR